MNDTIEISELTFNDDDYLKKTHNFGEGIELLMNEKNNMIA